MHQALGKFACGAFHPQPCAGRSRRRVRALMKLRGSRRAGRVGAPARDSQARVDLLAPFHLAAAELARPAPRPAQRVLRSRNLAQVTSPVSLEPHENIKSHAVAKTPRPGAGPHGDCSQHP
jgi:hypothetical protein